jgi:sec-independent protein translocase protein TatA
MALLPTVPLFPGIPGGPELLIILLVFVVLIGLPALLLLGGGAYLLSRRDGDRPSPSELQSRIDELETEVERLRERDGEE